MEETIINTKVTYRLQYKEQFYIIEHVPARICQETGEQYFSPETVERIQKIIKEETKPLRILETPVYEYA